jgi:hypothetical protein
MSRYLMTHSLLASWLYAMKEDPYADATTERVPYKEFLDVLNRVPTPTTEAMQNGLDFEDLVQVIAEHGSIPYGYGEEKWYDAAAKVANIVRGGQFQYKAKNVVTVGGIEFLLYGRLDVLKAGTIYDIKFSKSYDRGKYFSSTQHPLYLKLIPEAREFIYLISNGTDVWTETYTPTETRSIFPVISDFTDWLVDHELWKIYAEKWEAL